MRAEVEARLADFRRGAERSGSAQSPLQTTSAVRRVLAPGSFVERHTEKLRARKEKCATFVNDCKAVCILENVAGRNDEDTPTHCSAFEKSGYDHSQTTLMMGWRGKCEMSFTLEDHPHCKQLSGQDSFSLLCLTRARVFLSQIVGCEIRTAGPKERCTNAVGPRSRMRSGTIFLQPQRAVHNGRGSSIQQTECACPCCVLHTHSRAAKKSPSLTRIGLQALLDRLHGVPRGCERP